MRFLAQAMLGALILLLGSGLCGCLRTGSSQLEEEKDPHFLAGKSRVNALDYSGALECFEKALEANPHSASAHFEAGLLCEKSKLDHAAAIFHFQRFLELRPRSEYADLVRQRILACKQELAKAVLLGPVNQSLQREFERLTEENKRLKEQVEGWRAYVQALKNATNAASQPAPVPASFPSSTIVNASSRPGPAASAATNAMSRPGNAPVSTRTHVVKSGETPSVIARRYNVRVDALMAANPKTDARRLHVGQNLNIPVQ